LRSAHHDGRGCGDLRCWSSHHGRSRRRGRADHLRRVDRRCLILHGDVIGNDCMRACDFAGAAEHDARCCLRGRIARHPRDAARHLAGGADKMEGHSTATASMREVLGQAMRNRPFLVMSGAYFVCGLNLIFVTTHLPTYLAICGQDPMLSAEALAVIGGVSAVGSLLTGWLGSRYPKHIILGILYILRAVIFAAYFMLPPTPTSTLMFAAAMGLLWWPGLAPLIGGLVAEIFGTRYMATLLGLSFVVHQVGSSLGAWGGGLIFDISGSYDPAWQIGTIIGFAAGVVQILAGGPSRGHDRMLVPSA